MSYKIVDRRGRLPVHPTKRWAKRSSPPNSIVVHCSGSANQDPVQTAKYHISVSKDNHICKTGAPALCYADFISNAGIVYHCNSYSDITWHAGLFNSMSIGVVLAYEAKSAPPAAAQYQALEEHLTFLCLHLHILPQKVIGHREVSGMWTLLGNGSKKFKKTCPGLAVDLDLLRFNLAVRMQTFLAAQQLYKGPIDGKFGKLSKAALSQFHPAGQPSWLYYEV